MASTVLFKKFDYETEDCIINKYNEKPQGCMSNP